jgi:hypothetical protein
VSVEEGWVSTLYGVRTAAPVVVASVDQRTDVDLVTLLAPRRDGRTPTLRSADPASGSVVVDRADGTTDRIVWRAPHLEAQLGRSSGAGSPS